MQDQKMRDLKMKDQMSGHENAGPDNDGPNVRYLIFLVPHFRVLHFQSRFLAVSLQVT